MRTIKDISNDLLKDKDFGNPKSLEELGYIFFGPLVFNYFFWLKNEVKDGDTYWFEITTLIKDGKFKTTVNCRKIVVSHPII